MARACCIVAICVAAPGCAQEPLATEPNSSLIIAGDWAACVRREAIAARSKGSADEAVGGVLNACQTFAEPFERLATQEVGQEKAQRLLASHKQTVKEIGRATLRGERLARPDRLYAQVRRCIDDETMLAAPSNLQGAALVRTVREICNPIEQRARAEIVANLGQEKMREMAPDIDRVSDALVLQKVADIRAGRIRQR